MSINSLPWRLVTHQQLNTGSKQKTYSLSGFPVNIMKISLALGGAILRQSGSHCDETIEKDVI